MSLTLPGILRKDARTPRHKAVDEVARLRHQLEGAGLLIRGMRLQVAQAEDARDKANAKANLLQEADTRAAAVEARMRAMTEELTALRAFKANVIAVDSPTGHRDIDPDDQPTHPSGINVMTLRAAFGPTTDPGQTTWGARNQQQEATS